MQIKKIADNKLAFVSAFTYLLIKILILLTPKYRSAKHISR